MSVDRTTNLYIFILTLSQLSYLHCYLIKIKIIIFNNNYISDR